MLYGVEFMVLGLRFRVIVKGLGFGLRVQGSE